MKGPRLLIHQLRYDQRSFWRNPAAVFFAVMLPVVFLLIFATVFGNDPVKGRGVNAATYYVPSIAALGIVSATFVNMAMSLTILRERGVLKRLRGTPLPSWVFIASRMGGALAVSVLVVGAISLIGRVLYGVALPWSTLPGLALTLIVGALAFGALGIALTPLIPSEEAAPPITNGLILPMYFISGVFFLPSQTPSWMRTLADVFPVSHLANALYTAFDPFTQGTGIETADLAVIAAWGLFGFLAAAMRFRWTPRRG